MIHYIQGDLFKGIETIKGNIIIPHVVNCKGHMGAGFVVPLNKKWPITRELYMSWAGGGLPFNSPIIDRPLFELGETLHISVESNTIVSHMIAQTLGKMTRPLFYNHLAHCMDTVADEAIQTKSQIVCPKFGSALAGGDWNFISQLIEDCWIKRGLKVTVFEL